MRGKQRRRPTRRALFGLVIVASALAAGCQSRVFSMLDPGSLAGDAGSMSGASHLAHIRASHGLPALAEDGALEQAALRQAGYMAKGGEMEHTTRWGRDFASRMKKGGIEGAAAENIARGRMDMEELFRMWMDSPGHRRNMLDPRFSRFGLASAQGRDGQRYWALVLGR